MGKTIYRLECATMCGRQIDNVRRIPKGWQGVERVRSLRESRRLKPRPDEDEGDFSLLDWNTHTGYCPDCIKENREDCRDELEAMKAHTERKSR